ncbi:hypothetical protein HanXRQr2_Chr17g0827811 [Helianthus annuus]|uniref:Uncharacterized protein n=1 Tax=Helianthus annuus TaxID=4232 RepID=A0A9K3GWI5_HELAN|nr:hypothetical protein HanXRQr2_Chr17g0827811 [Helianthus annuus]KAJ0430892.1 hypothetical protein HanHA300_Chr17g0674271 [Helianthus annuus]KAJ0435944.1 hypothetical protein HanIR_Chr17g0899001 [Helianthus annuus]KAJ0449347.1 hypothetical protein HanHA89_Chr17g0727461 [Helianthus annuus]KAJ0634193.1 hypothetical protein HanLR1_Chr17g0685411 [Helianthus annuus]
MITTRTSEVDPTNDFDSFYYELERRMLTLIADDENEDCVGNMTAKRSTPVSINRQRSVVEQQTKSYFCWEHDSKSSTCSVPVWLVNMWRNTSSGTGVFFPRTTVTGGGFKPSRRCKGKKKNVSIIS